MAAKQLQVITTNCVAAVDITRITARSLSLGGIHRLNLFADLGQCIFAIITRSWSANVSLQCHCSVRGTLEMTLRRGCRSPSVYNRVHRSKPSTCGK